MNRVDHKYLNVYSVRRTSFVWFQLVADGDGLALEKIGADLPWRCDCGLPTIDGSVTEPQAIALPQNDGDILAALTPSPAVCTHELWIDYEVANGGWEGIFGFDLEWLNFALGEGIAPRQPFRVRFDQPNYHSHQTPDGTEYDVDFNWDIAWVEPLTDCSAANRWVEWLDEMHRGAMDGRIQR